MARLNIMKAIYKGRSLMHKHPGYSVGISNLHEIHTATKGDWAAALIDAYYLGACQGCKIAKKEMKDANRS